MRSILYDVKTGQVFCVERGWNSQHASIVRSWSTLIYHHRGPIIGPRGIWSDEAWANRSYIMVSLPCSIEELT